jgi:hypothetical protein
VYLQAAWRWEQPTAALEVELGPRDDFQLALWGTRPTAWRGLEGVAGSPRDAAWVAVQGVRAAAERIWVQRVRGTELEVVAAYPDDHSPMVTFVRRGEVSLGRYTGSATAAFLQAGRGWLVLATHGAAPQTVHIGRAI